MTNRAHQPDLFDGPVFPVRINAPQIDKERFERDIARAVGRALDQCPHDRFEVAKRMAVALGQDDFSKSMLDAYASEAKGTHTISMARFLALIKATGQDWLMDFFASRAGQAALAGEDVALAEKARLDNEIKRLQAESRKIKLPGTTRRRQRK